MKWNIFYFLVLAFIFSACSGKKKSHEEIYTWEEFNSLVQSSGISLDKSSAASLNFQDYSSNVNKLTSKAFLYERLSFIGLEFENESQAREEALRLNQYYSRNWVFDKVEGEPLLEDMLILKFHAKNPARRIQKNPTGHQKGASGNVH